MTAKPSVEGLSQRGLEQGEHCLGLRVAEAAVELDYGWAFFAPGQAGVEQTGIRGAAARHLLGHRGADLVHDALHAVLRQPRQRGVGAHATGIGALVVVIGALVVLSWQQRDDGLAID